MSNWKTTAAGVLTIISALSNAGLQYFHNQPVAFPVLWGGIVAGMGLIHAADAKPEPK